LSLAKLVDHSKVDEGYIYLLKSGGKLSLNKSIKSKERIKANQNRRGAKQE